MLICWTKEMRSVAARSSTSHRERAPRRLQFAHKIGEFSECIGVQRVVDPSAALPIGDETDVLENLQMERKSRLRGLQLILQLTHAPFAVLQHLQYGKSRLVGERVKELGRAVEICRR